MTETLKEYPNGGKIQVHPLVDKSAADFEKIIACCEHFALQGAKTLITPRFSETLTNPDYVFIYFYIKKSGADIKNTSAHYYRNRARSIDSAKVQHYFLTSQFFT